MRPVTDAEVAVDALAIAAVSVLICTSSESLSLMSLAVPVVLLARLAGWAWLRPGRPMLVELAFLSLCTLLGGFNDWSSVDRHQIYAYHAPHYFPDVSTIPLWMLLYWGLILRFFVTVATWRRLDAGAIPRDQVLGVDRPRLRVGLQLLLVGLTRQVIYQTYADPIWSWVPFLAAGLIYIGLFGLDRAEAQLVGIVLVVGPLIEVLYIQVAGLYAYSLGWLGGVPLWLVLWWMLAVLIWKDIGRRIELGLTRALWGQERLTLARHSVTEPAGNLRAPARP